jgi:large subunit ribosomal protein L30
LPAQPAGRQAGRVEGGANNQVMAKIKITQVKSGIDRPERQKLTLKALGLKKMHATKEVEATPQILGMVRTVEHLVKVEEVK